MNEYCYAVSQIVGIIVGLAFMLILGIFIGYRLKKLKAEEKKDDR